MPETRQKTILLVEDEAIIAISEQKQLETEGYLVLHSFNGETAIDLVCVKKEPVDLILMDIDLGRGIDGTEAANQILALVDVPILFLSAHTEKEKVEKTESITNYGYVVKNSSFTVLDASIKMAFKLFDAKCQLKERQAFLESVVETTQDGFYVLDARGYFIDANSVFCKMIGYSKRELVSFHLSDISSEFTKDKFLERTTNVFENDYLRCETRHRKKDGSYIIVEVSICWIKKYGVSTSFCRDISERKIIEEALKKSESKYQAFYDSMRDAYVSIDMDGAIIESNPVFETLLGYSKEELVGMKNIDFSTAENNEYEKTVVMSQLLEFGYSDVYQKEYKRKDGTVLPVELRVSLLRDSFGEPFQMCAIVRDISGRKKTEEELKKYQERLEFALEVSGLGEWEYNLKTKQMFRSKRWAEMLGYSQEEMKDSFNQGIELQHPDDREIVSKTIQDYYDGRIDKFKIDYRMRTKNGEYKWIQDCGQIMERNKYGAPVRSGGTHADIDDQKKSQYLLLKEQKRLQNFLHGMNAGTWELNVQTGEATIDSDSAALLGYSLDELNPNIFQSWMQLKQPDDLIKSNELLKRHVQGETDSYSFESRMKHKNGTWVWIHGFGKIAEWDKSGNPLRIFGTHIDITERKQNEIALRESQERLQFALEGSGLGEWDWDLRTNKIKRNERWAEILGYTLSEIEDSLQQGIDLEHPDDREISWKAIQDHLSGKSEYYDVLYRMKAKDGQYRWIHDCGKIMERDEFGKPVRLCGTHADITDQKKKDDKIKSLLVEKEITLKEVHHRIKNNMNTISSLLSLQAGAMSEQTAVIALKDAENRVRSMSLLYDKLYRSAGFTELPVNEYLSSLVDEVVINFPNCNFITIEKYLQEFMLDAKCLQSLGIIVNELLTNIMKYAFKERETGFIKVTATNVNRHVTISVYDDGIGMPESVSFEKSTGFGFQLVKALTEQLQGSVHIERGKGTKIIIEFEILG